MQNKTFKFLIQALPLLLVAVLAIWMLLSGEQITADRVRAWLPDSLWPAIFILLALYAVKSIVVLIPLTVLCIAGGMIFPPVPAVVINTLGSAVVIALGYAVGRSSGAGALERICNRYPRLDALLKLNRTSDFRFSFYLRMIGIIPCEPASLCMGAMALSFWPYLAGSTLGMLPAVAAYTLMGSGILREGSPLFWIALAILGVTVGVGALMYFFYLRRARRTDERA